MYEGCGPRWVGSGASLAMEDTIFSSSEVSHEPEAAFYRFFNLILDCCRSRALVGQIHVGLATCTSSVFDQAKVAFGFVEVPIYIPAFFYALEPITLSWIRPCI